MSNETAKLPSKIVNHIAVNAINCLQEAICEAKELSKLSIFINKDTHPGIDMAVLREKLKNVYILIELLCEEDL